MAALVLLAAGLRFAYPGRMAVEHFDEGVYASNIFFTAEEGGQYPYRHLYAPPLLPFLIEWGIIFLGPDSIAPFLPALVLGTATVPLAWWAARCWFGPASGLAAGLLVATSDFHLLYSRTALTDVPVAFFLLLAVYLYWESVRRASLGWAVAVGVATGLAWWTKYTGWLPLAIAASGGAAWVITEWRSTAVSPRVRLTTVTKPFVVTAITAFVVWSPVLWGLQEYGGYAAVAENHRGYLQPIAHWTHNLWRQFGNIAAQSGACTVVATACLAAAVPLRSGWPLALRLPLALWGALVVGWAVFEIGPAVPLAVLALTGLSFELIGSVRVWRDESERSQEGSNRRLAGWLLAAWFCGMLATTPLYYQYPRLAMPWLLAAILGTTLWGRRHLSAIRSEAVWQTAFAASLFALPAACFVSERRLVSSDPWYTARWSVPGWQDRTSAQAAAREVVHRLRRLRPDDGPVALYTAVGPAMFFQLRSLLVDDPAMVVPLAEWRGRVDVPDGVTAYLVLNFQPAHVSPEGDYSDGSPDGTSLQPLMAFQPVASDLVGYDSSPSDGIEERFKVVFLFQILP